MIHMLLTLRTNGVMNPMESGHNTVLNAYSSPKRAPTRSVALLMSRHRRASIPETALAFGVWEMEAISFKLTASLDRLPRFPKGSHKATPRKPIGRHPLLRTTVTQEVLPEKKVVRQVRTEQREKTPQRGAPISKR